MLIFRLTYKRRTTMAWRGISGRLWFFPSETRRVLLFCVVCKVGLARWKFPPAASNIIEVICRRKERHNSPKVYFVARFEAISTFTTPLLIAFVFITDPSRHCVRFNCLSSIYLPLAPLHRIMHSWWWMHVCVCTCIIHPSAKVFFWLIELRRKTSVHGRGTNQGVGKSSFSFYGPEIVFGGINHDNLTRFMCYVYVEKFTLFASYPREKMSVSRTLGCNLSTYARKNEHWEEIDVNVKSGGLNYKWGRKG